MMKNQLKLNQSEVHFQANSIFAIGEHNFYMINELEYGLKTDQN